MLLLLMGGIQCCCSSWEAYNVVAPHGGHTMLLLLMGGIQCCCSSWEAYNVVAPHGRHTMLLLLMGGIQCCCSSWGAYNVSQLLVSVLSEFKSRTLATRAFEYVNEGQLTLFACCYNYAINSS